MSEQTTFRAGDTVKHGPSGETWVLAVDEERGRVMPAGWPESMADAKDCTLVEAATDAERQDMLTRFAEKHGDARGEAARRQLKPEPPPAADRQVELPTCRGCLARCVEPLRDGLCGECWTAFPALRDRDVHDV